MGFTTNAADARSFPNASDTVKSFGVPIIRVNSNDVDSVLRIGKLMVRYWQKFHQDILVDMIGYRKYGHNEVDEPSFTQPHMYQVIRQKKGVAYEYAHKLIHDGVIKEKQY